MGLRIVRFIRAARPVKYKAVRARHTLKRTGWMRMRFLTVGLMNDRREQWGLAYILQFRLACKSKLTLYNNMLK